MGCLLGCVSGRFEHRATDDLHLYSSSFSMFVCSCTKVNVVSCMVNVVFLRVFSTLPIDGRHVGRSDCGYHHCNCISFNNQQRTRSSLAEGSVVFASELPVAGMVGR